MKSNEKNQSLYFSAIGILCLLTYLLNISVAIYQCALMFTLIAVTMNAIFHFYGSKKAISSLLIAVIVSMIAFQGIPYYIDGKIINGLVVMSLLSLMMSMFCSLYVLSKLKNKYSMMMLNLLSIGVSSGLDGLAMSVFFRFSSNFSYSRIIEILYKEFSYKILYMMVASLLITTIVKIFKNSTKSTII